MNEVFDRAVWKSGVVNWWHDAARDLSGTQQRLQLRTHYGLLLASAWQPLLDAYAANPVQAETVLVDVSGAAGTGLALNLARGAYDRAAGAATAEREAVEHPDLRGEYQELLENLDVVSAARATLGSGWPSFELSLRRDLAEIGSALYPAAGGGMVIRGDVSVQHGDFIGRDKIVHTKVEMLVRQATSAVDDAEKARQLALKRLAEGVRDYAQGIADLVAHDPDELGGPYKGLLAYELADAELFFGRDLAIAELLERLRRGRLTILHAKSGVGKSSLLQAGIAPRLLADGHLPVHIRARNLSPDLAIRKKLVADLDRISELADMSLHEFLRQVTRMLGSSTRVYLLLDQFEEFFTQLDSESARDRFVAELADCLDDASLRVRWVLAVRSEYLGEIVSFRSHVRNPIGNQVQLGALTLSEAREAILKPAAAHGVHFEAGLVDDLLADFQQSAIEPPQMQLVCRELHQGLAAGETIITHAHYDAMGGVRGILHDHLARVIERVKSPSRNAAPLLLDALIDADRHRARRTRSELVSELALQGVQQKHVDTLLDALVEERLIEVEGEEPSCYELVHEYLIDQIERDPVTETRKTARALLDREVESHRRLHTLISGEKLAILEPHGALLVPDVDALDLLFRSALRHRRGLEHWSECATRLHRVQTLATRWIGLLAGTDETQARIGASLLHGLPEEEIVGLLIEQTESEAADDGHSLRSVSARRLRILQILAQMSVPDATQYLHGLTPEGYCFVPAGEFKMGSEEHPDEQRGSSVRLPAFWIARSPVTVAEWREFVAAGGYVEDRYWARLGAGAQRPLPVGWKIDPDREQHPVQNVTWHEAMAYAAWKADVTGMPVALPTEAEWEKAAGWDNASGKAHRYPWGDTPDPARCNALESGVGGTSAVGSYAGVGDSPCGAHDMAGNVLEWTRTRQVSYPYQPDDGRESLAGDYARVLRGGSFDHNIADARCARRHQLHPAFALASTGCRLCLRLVPLNGEEGEPESTAPALR